MTVNPKLSRVIDITETAVHNASLSAEILSYKAIYILLKSLSDVEYQIHVLTQIL